MRKAILPLSLSVLLAVILISLGTDQVFLALRAFFIAPLSNPFYLTSMISLASLLLLSGSGISLAFSAGSFNLGGEGQSYAGGLAPAFLMLLMGSRMEAWMAPLILLLGILTAMLVSGVQGWAAAELKNRLSIDPLISTFLLSSALLPFMDSLIIGPLRDQESNLLSMPRIPEFLRLPALPSLPRIHLGILLSLAAWAAVMLWYHHSRRGFEVKMAGANADFARFMGLPVGRLLSLVMIVSAALHGLAGFIALVGVQHAAVVGFTAGIGWNGIAVSLIGGNRLRNLPVSALIFASLITASNAAMVFTDFSFELSTVIQASVFLLISVDFAWRRNGFALLKSRLFPTSGEALK